MDNFIVWTAIGVALLVGVFVFVAGYEAGVEEGEQKALDLEAEVEQLRAGRALDEARLKLARVEREQIRSELMARSEANPALDRLLFEALDELARKERS